MALDPNDPLIPLPWQMEGIREYRKQRALEAEKDRLAYQKAAIELEEKMLETPEGRIAQAEELTKRAEETRQKREGVKFGDVARQVAMDEGKSLLAAGMAQRDYDINQRVLAARQGAIENILTGEKGLIPTAKVDVGGMTATVPFSSGGEAMASSYGQIYRNMVPQLAQTYMAEGFERDDAIRMASEAVRNQLIKAGSSGKVVLAGADGVSTISYSNEEAQRMWKDPKTPKHLRDQLNGFFGAQEGPTASDWVKNQTRR